MSRNVQFLLRSAYALQATRLNGGNVHRKKIEKDAFLDPL